MPRAKKPIAYSGNIAIYDYNESYTGPDYVIWAYDSQGKSATMHRSVVYCTSENDGPFFKINGKKAYLFDFNTPNVALYFGRGMPPYPDHLLPWEEDDATWREKYAAARKSKDPEYGYTFKDPKTGKVLGRWKATKYTTSDDARLRALKNYPANIKGNGVQIIFNIYRLKPEKSSKINEGTLYFDKQHKALAIRDAYGGVLDFALVDPKTGKIEYRRR